MIFLSSTWAQSETKPRTMEDLDPIRPNSIAGSRTSFIDSARDVLRETQLQLDGKDSITSHRTRATCPIVDKECGVTFHDEDTHVLQFDLDDYGKVIKGYQMKDGKFVEMNGEDMVKWGFHRGIEARVHTSAGCLIVGNLKRGIAAKYTCKF